MGLIDLAITGALLAIVVALGYILFEPVHRVPMEAYNAQYFGPPELQGKQTALEPHWQCNI